MENKSEELLEKVIEQQFEDLSSYEPGSKERSDAIDNLIQLYKLRVEETKIKVEESFRESELKSRVKDRKINIGLQIALAMLPLIAYNRWFRLGLKFNETGVIADPLTKNLLSRMLPNRK